MAQDGQGGEKTEEPTEKRLSDAREKGQIAKSPELMTAAVLLGMAITFMVAGPPLWAFLLDTMGRGLATAADEAVAGDASIAWLQGLGWRTLAAMGGVLAASVVIAIGVNGAQVGALVTTKPLAPQFSRINPISGAKRIFSSRSIMELFKSLSKLAIVAGAVWYSMKNALPDLEVLPLLQPTALMDVIRQYSLVLIRNAGALFLLVAGADYGYQRWKRVDELKMTKQEVKDEYKNAEGDANIKARRRSIARDRIRKQMFTDVPSADVVIVNPTHIAIAIKYDPDFAPAPFVLALGERKVAERIKAIAFAAGVPVIENKPLARALIKTARVGSMIPVDLYLAVAEVLAYVMRQRQRMGGVRVLGKVA